MPPAFGAANVGNGLPLTPDQRHALLLAGGASPSPASFQQPRDVARQPQTAEQQYPLSSSIADWVQNATGWRPGTTPSWVPQGLRDLSASNTAFQQQTMQDLGSLGRYTSMSPRDLEIAMGLGMGGEGPGETPGIGHNLPPEKVPGINDLTNPLPYPEDYQAGIERGVKRRDLDVSKSRGEATNPATELAPGVYVGDVNTDQWIQRTEHHLTPDEIAQARNWYKDALPAYQKYFGQEDAPAHMGAWLIANRNVDPAGAQLNAMRVAEQQANLTGQFSPQKQGGLADAVLRQYWGAVRGGDTSGLARLGGQKIYDFIDSALGKDTRTFYGDDPRMGSPAVADVHSLRDMGHIDDPTINWVRQKYGDDAANQLQKSFGGSPSEAQYEWSADKMRRITDELNQRNYMGDGWTPSEVQATGWMTMSRQLGRAGQTAEQAIQAHTRNVSAELDFGKGAPYHDTFPDWKTLTPDQKYQVTQEVMPQIGDFARRVTGVQGGQTNVGLGGWGSDINPSMKSRLIASPEVAQDYANVLGHLAQQTEVFGYRPAPNGPALGVGIHGEGLQDPANVTKLWTAFTAKHPDLAAGFSPSIHPDGTHGIEMLFDKGGTVMKKRIESEVIPSLHEILQDQGVEGHIQGFQAEKTRTGHDWQADPTGGSYLARLGQRYGPDLPNRLELYRKEQLEPAIRQAIDRAKAGSSPGTPPEAGPQQITPSTAPDLGAVSRRPPQSRRGLPTVPVGAPLGTGMARAGLKQQQ